MLLLHNQYMQNFRQLEVWQRAHTMSIEIHRVCRTFPWYEQLGLSSQMRRSSSSVAFNIAEGFGRKVAQRSNVDLLHFLAQSSGSLHELDNALEYARDVEYLARPLAAPYLDEVAVTRRKLARLITHLRENDSWRR